MFFQHGYVSAEPFVSRRKLRKPINLLLKGRVLKSHIHVAMNNIYISLPIGSNEDYECWGVIFIRPTANETVGTLIGTSFVSRGEGVTLMGTNISPKKAGTFESMISMDFSGSCKGW